MSSIKLESNASGTGVFSIASPNSNTNRTLTLPDATGTIITTAGGAAISGTTGTFTGLVDISAAGAGQIQFPATQNASSNANTLDDYEEGNWTPTVTPSSGSLTAYTSSGVYVKAGRFVMLVGNFILTTVGTAGGSVSVGGIPFSGTKPSTAYRTSIGSGREDALTGVFYQVVLGGNTNTIVLNTAAGAEITWTNNYEYTFCVTYEASA